MFRDVRRKDRLAEKEAGVSLLEKSEYGVLSVLGDGGYPYGVPVNFVYKDDCIYIHGFLEGHKMDAVGKCPKVCFTVVDGVDVRKDQVSTNYTSVIAFGSADVIDFADDEARQAAFAAIMDKYIPGEGERTARYTREHEKNTNIIRIRIEHMTCKKRDVR